MPPRVGQVLRNARGSRWQVTRVEVEESSFKVELKPRLTRTTPFGQSFKLTGSQFRLFCALEGIIARRPTLNGAE